MLLQVHLVLRAVTSVFSLLQKSIIRQNRKIKTKQKHQSKAISIQGYNHNGSYHELLHTIFHFLKTMAYPPA